MNVTNEFLSAMFAAYWPTEFMVKGVATDVEDWDGYSIEEIKRNGVTVFHNEHGCHTFGYNEIVMALTPLSEISDEDAVEVCRMAGYGAKNVGKVIGIRIEERGWLRIEFENYVFAMSIRPYIVDYLRSRHYDCGFMHIPSLINAGLAVKK